MACTCHCHAYKLDTDLTWNEIQTAKSWNYVLFNTIKPCDTVNPITNNKSYKLLVVAICSFEQKPNPCGVLQIISKAYFFSHSAVYVFTALCFMSTIMLKSSKLLHNKRMLLYIERLNKSIYRHTYLNFWCEEKYVDFWKSAWLSHAQLS